MNQVGVEAFLARLYVDAALRTAFVSDPRGSALAAGLSSEIANGLCEMDFEGLELAASSYAKKRSHKSKRQALPWFSRVRRLWRRWPSQSG